MEMMTEFVFREKLKKRKKYSEIDMFPEINEDDDDEPNSDEEDLKDDVREKYLIDERSKNSQKTIENETLVKADDEDDVSQLCDKDVFVKRK
jgi:hypothetical protein